MNAHYSSMLINFCLGTLLSVCAAGSMIGRADAQSTDQRVGLPVAEILQEQLKQAGDNRAELETAISQVPADQKPAVEFLIANMPVDDLKNLSADFLVNNVRLAYEARSKAPWQIPEEIFLNEVLPYANIDEPRDPWRKEFFELCWPIVQDCKTPSEAAQKLNETVFKKISVKYSTARKRANQSPQESIEQGLASCTGLTIILVDACRSVGVPARLVGIPSWKNKSGNHTWAEIWDQGWHFTGAAEPSAQGLNHAWFQNDAALADPDSNLHSIYAVSFCQTEIRFPMVWSPTRIVFAENVTKRYLPAEKAEVSADSADSVNVMIRVWDRDRKKRIVSDVQIENLENEKTQVGQSRSDSADMNDMLTFQLKPKANYRVRIKSQNRESVQELKTTGQPNQVLEFAFDEADQPSESALNHDQQELIRKLAKQLFDSASTSPEQVAEWETANQILAEQPDAVRQLVWDSYRTSVPGQSRKSDFEKNQVIFDTHVSPYTIKEVGQRPEHGWPLFIAMHGGGGAPQELNDSQWRHMQIYYKDQPQVTGYKYLALRAPNNTWNGFYDDYVYPLIENLIQQCVVFADVDPDKVFIMGYSHGGYGAFAIGPKIPYRFAAIHASAAAPTDGQTSAKTLRNTRFTFMVGEKDEAYGRRKRCEQFAVQVKELQADPGNSGDEYPVEFMFKEGYGHGGLPDREMIGSMYPNRRNATPKHLTWEMTDSVVKHFFWLSVEQPARGKWIDAKISGNEVAIESSGVDSLTIHLDRRLIDPEQPIKVVRGETNLEVDYKPDLNTLCRSVAEMGDVNLAYDFQIAIDAPPAAKRP